MVRTQAQPEKQRVEHDNLLVRALPRTGAPGVANGEGGVGAGSQGRPATPSP